MVGDFVYSSAVFYQKEPEINPTKKSYYILPGKSAIYHV